MRFSVSISVGVKTVSRSPLTADVLLSFTPTCR